MSDTDRARPATDAASEQGASLELAPLPGKRRLWVGAAVLLVALAGAAPGATWWLAASRQAEAERMRLDEERRRIDEERRRLEAEHREREERIERLRELYESTTDAEAKRRLREEIQQEIDRQRPPVPKPAGCECTAGDPLCSCSKR